MILPRDLEQFSPTQPHTLFWEATPLVQVSYMDVCYLLDQTHILIQGGQQGYDHSCQFIYFSGGDRAPHNVKF